MYQSMLDGNGCTSSVERHPAAKRCALPRHDDLVLKPFKGRHISVSFEDCRVACLMIDTIGAHLAEGMKFNDQSTLRGASHVLEHDEC